MPAKVADASVIAALIFQEPQAPQALRLLEGAILYEPPLLGFELASVARKKIQSYPDKRGTLLAALQFGLEMDYRWTEVDQLEAVVLSLDLGLSPYDAAYLWVAKACNAPLVTFDKRLGRAAARG